MKRRISVFGAGAWGTALSQTLARNGHQVKLWSFSPDNARAINETGYHPSCLQDYQLSSLISATGSLEEAAGWSQLWLLVTPTQFLRGVLQQLAPMFQPGGEICNAAKGVEIATLKLASQIVEELLPGAAMTALSGPSHAEEVIRNLPTAVTSASDRPLSARLWQEIFNRDTFRVYTSDDLIGVEVGGAVKNVVAIASGFLHSLEMGDNATAAMICRGLAEIQRLGMAMGGRALTFSGLAGMGDLVVTAYSRHSRNFRLGELMGQGYSLEEAKEALGQVAEGAYTVQALRELSSRLGVELPISDCVYRMLYQGLAPQEAVASLLSRDPKAEHPCSEP